MAKMNILTYNQLNDKSDIFLLWAKSFGFHCTSDWIDMWAPQDVRLQGTPIGFCAVENEKLLGFVGVMHLPTRNKHGDTEAVGGIWAVATRPTTGRRGIGRKLLDAAENHFREQGIRLSLLTTSRSIVAYRWYSEVGYSEIEAVNRYPHFYQFPRHSPNVELGKGTGDVDRHHILEIFHKHIRNNCGFTYRDEALMRFLEFRGPVDYRHSVVEEDAYFIATGSLGTLLISEILAPNQKSYSDLLKRAESMTREAVYSRYVFDENAAIAFEKARYRTDPEEYNVAMWKSLDGTKFSDIFDESFVMPRLDFF